MVEKLLNSKLTKLWFALSVTAFTGLHVNTGSIIGMALNVLVAFVLAIFIGCKYKILDKLFKIKSRKYVLISLAIAIYMVIVTVINFYSRCGESFFTASENSFVLKMQSLFSEQLIRCGLYMFLVAAGIVALFIVFAAVYAIISRAKMYTLCLIKGSDKIERLYIMIGTVVFSALIIFIYSVTEVAYTTQVRFDLIFTTDSGCLIETDAFFTPAASENDIRQPLFALLTMPFAVAAKILSIPFFFLPCAYILIMQIIQVVALLIMAVLVVRMAGINNNISKTIFLVLYGITYPVLLFSFIVEQYIPSVFIAVLTVYIFYYQKRQNIWLAALSSGALLTNAIMVPFIAHEKLLAARLSLIIRVAAAFIVLCVFSGKLSVLLGAFNSIRSLLLFADIGVNGNAGYNKLYQFTHFVKNCFVAPQAVVVFNENNIATFQLAIPTGVSLLGVALLSIFIVSVIININIIFIKICGLWGLFSVILLCVIGWGSPENGIILYSLYFNWSFFTLVFLFFEKVLKGQKIIKYAIYSIIFVVMTVININGIMDLVQFGIQFYPVR